MISPILKTLKDLHEKYKHNDQGHLPTYIPELSRADSNHFGICLATVDGMVYEVGDSHESFSIQSISKVFTYGLVLEDLGPEEVLIHVGVEPSGEAFNSIEFDEHSNRPFNPMVNAGAIAISALIKGKNFEERLQRVKKILSDFAGRDLSVDETIYLSEKLYGHRNRAIAYLELNSKMIKEPIKDHLDLYFQQCSVSVTAHDLAIMAATLANNGINPLSKKQVEDPDHVLHMLSVMQSCGMYDFSGEWAFRVGLPAKSGVSGGILAVVPGFLGIGIFSPLVDARGNSVRGIQVCEELSKNFELHMFAGQPFQSSVIRRHYTSLEENSKGRSIIQVYELQGDLFFSTIEQLCRKFQTLEISQALNEKGFIIFDCTHVGRVNLSAFLLLNSLREMLAQHNFRMLITGKDSPLHTIIDSKTSWPKHDFFDSTQQALSYCENLNN